jgi:hypothetical protein
MSLAQQALTELQSAHEYFNRSTRNLTEASHSLGRGVMTAAQRWPTWRHDRLVPRGAFRPGDST